MSNSARAVMYWFIGIVLVSATILLVVLYLVATIHGIQTETLHSIIDVWEFGTFIVAIVPLLLIPFGVVDDRMKQDFSKNGLRLIVQWNVIAWVLWVGMFLGIFFWLGWQLLRLMFPCR